MIWCHNLLITDSFEMISTPYKTKQKRFYENVTDVTTISQFMKYDNCHSNNTNLPLANMWEERKVLCEICNKKHELKILINCWKAEYKSDQSHFPIVVDVVLGIVFKKNQEVSANVVSPFWMNVYFISYNFLLHLIVLNVLIQALSFTSTSAHCSCANTCGRISSRGQRVYGKCCAFEYMS